MAVRHEKDLSDPLRNYWLKAVAALELRNFGYAIELLQTLLRQEPEFLTGRQMLRRAEVSRLRSEKKGFFKVPSAPLAVMKAHRELKRSPQKAIELVEKVLEANPYNSQANMILKDAAILAGYPDVAMFAMETLLENQPRDLRVLHELGRLYYQHERAADAVKVYDRIIAIDPSDHEAAKLGKDASAHASMQKSGWARAESYRDVIKDKEAATSLEQQNRKQLSDELLEQQIEEVFAQHEAEPENIALVKRLGLLHDQKGDLAGAIAWYEYAVSLTNKGDLTLVRLTSDLKLRQLDLQIREEKDYLAEHSAQDQDFAPRAARLEGIKQQRIELLVDQAQERLDRNPADLKLRYELGEQLALAGQYREALPELQRARQNPNLRLQAMNLLGLCYRKLGMLDLSARQLETAASEMTVMDAMKKEIVYNLGLAYEEMGEMARYIEAMKRIYEADYGYRDVAGRVEHSYGATQSS